MLSFTLHRPIINIHIYYCTFFLGACAKQLPKIKEKKIDACIGETLKHAPHCVKVVATPVSCFIHWVAPEQGLELELELDIYLCDFEFCYLISIDWLIIWWTLELN